jgi:S-DNA-T family DNA segregation ATPase FtsK/SpoIIIE
METQIANPPHEYRNLTADQYEELFSNYLLDSWSYSKINSFSNNEKAFEMFYIYRKRGKYSSSAVAGTAYHKALQSYFNNLKDGVVLDLVALEKIAFNDIDNIPANQWKIQKTVPTIESCILKATEMSKKLLTNFMKEADVYLSDLKEVLYVEVYSNEFLTINGVDIPLPCHAIIDLVIRTKDDKIVVIDHKSKAAFTSEEELKFSVGKQAITYVKSLESKFGITVDEAWFIENKTSENRDKSPQLNCFKITIDNDCRRLYEAMLYEPLKRMIEAISNPDYVYLINEMDNLVDKAELYDFWALTLIAEVNDFDVPENKKDLISKRLKKIRDASLATINPSAIKAFREGAEQFIQYDLSNKNMSAQQKIEHVLRSLRMVVNVAHTFEGFSSNTYLIEMSAGTGIASIQKYKMDIASALNVSSIRMQKDLFVYEGKSYIAIESSKIREKDLLWDPSALVGYKIPIGIDNFNQPVVWDMDNPSTPHVLICGSTGSGKSVCIISIVEYAKLAGIQNIVIFDPKYEFTQYSSAGITVLNDIDHIESKMESLVLDMNELVKTGQNRKTLVIFDEFADAVAASKSGNALNVYEDVVVGYNKDGGEKTKREKVETKKSLEENLKILLQKGRSCGFRILAATQRASVKVITGDAKVNFPVQICFRVPKEIDSTVVLGEVGAESLSGRGDGIIRSPEYANAVRFQSYYKK